ncbi:vasorin [Sceloporus undulatus]|uniref:vasorin n=1 Tax=Sceloporus undulatus TaxID=8520 RepID=UPI001C4DA6C8|nr:vasorin [Sceloporus undulatus]
MGPLLLWALLLLLPAGTLTQGCPSECQCSQPQTVFCISRRSQTVPQGLPPETATLYLFENGIQTLSEESFVGLPALQLLDLSQNQLSGLPRGVFQPLATLSNLDLSSNQLQEVTNESFHGLRLLERLYLDHNQIQQIHPAAFDSLENLLELKLQDNHLRALPPLHLPALLLLNLSRNPITALEPSAFQGVPSLESLKVAGLGLGHLDEELLQGLGNLHELDLSDNLLPAVPNAVLKELRGLTKLSLAGNAQISQLRAEDLQDLRNLQELDISNLRLTTLPRDLFGAFPQLKALTAAENPFNCICPMSWVVGWLSAGKALLRRPEETRCHFPPKNAGRLLQHLQYVDFGCPTTTTATTTTLRVTTDSPKLATTVPSILGSGLASLEPSTAGGPMPTDGSPAPTPFHLPEVQPSPEVHLCPPGTCLNGGACQLDAGNHLECICLPGYSGLYCESQVRVTTVPSATQALTPHPKQIAVRPVGATSLKVDLQSYIQSKPRLKGVRLTYWNLSGPDKRPVTLSLPASLPDYTVRALKPNSSYHLCLGPLGDKGHEEEHCVEARTLPLTRQQHAPVTQGKDPGLSLVAVAVPATVAVLLLVAVTTAVSYYVWRRRRQQRQGKEAQATLGAKGSGPLELEGVKACLEKGDPSGHGPKALSPNGLDHEAPLMQPPLLQAGGGPCTPRPLRPSYF